MHHPNFHCQTIEPYSQFLSRRLDTYIDGMDNRNTLPVQRTVHSQIESVIDTRLALGLKNNVTSFLKAFSLRTPFSIGKCRLAEKPERYPIV